MEIKNDSSNKVISKSVTSIPNIEDMRLINLKSLGALQNYIYKQNQEAFDLFFSINEIVDKNIIKTKVEPTDSKDLGDKPKEV